MHGIKVIEINEGARRLTTVSTAIIGLVATGTTADTALFPLNRPVLITNLTDAISKAGTGGTLRPALEAIAAQSSPVVVVVRVAEGLDTDATNSNVIGSVSDGQMTGLQALLAAENQLGVKPRIIGAPGLDTQPVTTAMVSVAQKLRAMAYAGCVANTVEEAVLYRNNFAARELMLIWPDFLVWDGAANAAAARPASAYALGLRARIDQEQGWHKTLSNVAVNGVMGLNRDISWDLQDETTDAGVLNAAGITTLVNRSGFRYWGNRTCSDEPLFAFESAARTAQVLSDTIADGLMWAVDKPLHKSLVRDIVETINASFRSLKTEGFIIDANAWFDAEQNPASQLSAGKLIIDYDYTPVPPLESLTLRQRITDRYLADFANGL